MIGGTSAEQNGCIADATARGKFPTLLFATEVFFVFNVGRLMKGLRPVPPKQLGDISVLLYGRTISRSEFPLPPPPQFTIKLVSCIGFLAAEQT